MTRTLMGMSGTACTCTVISISAPKFRTLMPRSEATRTSHQRPDSVDKLDRPHLDARFSPSASHVPLRHPIAVEPCAVRAVLRESRLLLLVEVRRRQAERSEEALLVENGDGVDHEQGEVGYSAQPEPACHGGVVRSCRSSCLGRGSCGSSVRFKTALEAISQLPAFFATPVCARLSPRLPPDDESRLWLSRVAVREGDRTHDDARACLAPDRHGRLTNGELVE